MLIYLSGVLAGISCGYLILSTTFRKNSPPATEAFTVDVDPLEPVARVSFQNQQFVLKEGEWSGWVPVEFQLMPVIGNVKGICRFFLKQAHPRFQLYVSPINIDPANPALPISTPSSYSRDLAKEIGQYHTQGIAEDTKALSDGVLDDSEYLEQARTVLAEHRRAFAQRLVLLCAFAIAHSESCRALGEAGRGDHAQPVIEDVKVRVAGQHGVGQQRRYTEHPEPQLPGRFPRHQHRRAQHNEQQGDE